MTPPSTPDPRRGRRLDPPPRPMPEVADRDANSSWIPGKTRKNIPVATIVTRSLVVLFSLAAIGGVYLVVSKVFESYFG